MMLFIKKVNFIVYLAVALVLGFGFGCLVRSTGVQDDLLAASVAKASLYNNQKEDPAVSVAEEKLKNDSEFRESTLEVMELLKERMAGLSDLTDRTLKACSEIPDFIELNTTFQSLQAKAYNTNLAIESVTAGIDKILEGKSAPEYEVASNNVYIGYQKINKQLEAGKRFVDAAEEYLKNNMESENAPAVAELITDWSVYCAEDAVLNGKEDELAYWRNRYDNVYDGVLAAYDQQMGRVDQQMGRVDQQMGRVDQQMGRVDQQMGRVDQQMGRVDQQMGRVDQQMGRVDQQMGRVDQQMGRVDQQMGRVDQQMGRVDQQMGRIDQQMGRIDQQMGRVDQQMSRLDQQMGRVDQQMGRVDQQMGRLDQQMGRFFEDF